MFEIQRFLLEYAKLSSFVNKAFSLNTKFVGVLTIIFLKLKTIVVDK